MDDPTTLPAQIIQLVDIAWATGLYEGEGTCAISNNSHVIVQLSMTDSEPVKRFHQIVGVGAVYTYQPPSPRKLVYRWQTQKSDEVVKVLTMLIDSGYLGPRRLEQAERVLTRAKEITPRSSGRRLTEKKKEQLAILTRLGLRNG